MKLTPQKLEGWSYRNDRIMKFLPYFYHAHYGENFMIRSSTIFIRITMLYAVAR